MTWTLVLNPIVISGQVDVRSSATLTVEPGVHVVFTDPLATIEVFGMLADRDGCSNECKLVVDIAVRL